MLNLLLFFACYISGFVLALAANPVWAFMVYQVVYFMNPLERWWSYMVPSLSYSLYTVLLMGFVFLRDYRARQLNRLLAAPQFKWIYLIAFGYIIALAYASMPLVNQEATINLVKLVIIVSIAYKLVDTSRKLDGVLAAYIAGAAYIGFLTYQVGRNVGDRVEGIGTVDSPDSNGIAAAIAPTIVLCLYYFWVSKSKWIKLLVAVAGAFIANGIVLINSRGAFLATVVSLGFFLATMFFSKHQRKHQKASAVAVVVLGLIGAAIIVDESAIQRFSSIKTQEMTEEQETGATRMFFWLAAIDMAKDHPFGAGAKGFEYHAPEYIPSNIDSGASRNRSVHSTWFEALTDLGYPGIFCLLMMILSCYRATRRCKKILSETGRVDDYYKVVAIEATFLAYIIAMSFMNRFRAEILYWCVLFTACAYNIYVVRSSAVSNIELTGSSRRRPAIRTVPRVSASTGE